MKLRTHYHKQQWHSTKAWRKYQIFRFFVPNPKISEQSVGGIGLVFFTHELSIVLIKGENVAADEN